jgi:hypothetical protein
MHPRYRCADLIETRGQYEAGTALRRGYLIVYKHGASHSISVPSPQVINNGTSSNHILLV